jgi:hypothetical protein
VSGVDEGFGSSSTAVVLTEFLKEERKIRILYAEEFEHANPQDIVDLCFNLYKKHWNTWFWVDGANRAFVNLMKVAFNEPLSWENNKQAPNPEAWKVLPVNFATENKQIKDPRTITTPASIVFDTFGNWGLEYFNLLVVCFYFKNMVGLLCILLGWPYRIAVILCIDAA